MSSEYKKYRRVQIAELADWEPEFDMTGVSINDVDRANGSPQAGDKIEEVKAFEVEDRKDLTKALAKAGVGTKLRVAIKRGEKSEEITIELGKGL